MLNKELTALQEELNYHRNSIQELEERIAEVKVYDGYAAQATEAVEEAIEQIGMGKYLWLFKEHILSMFPEQPPAYLEDRVEEDKDIVPQEVEEIKPEKSYHELTGKPDLRPTTYEDLASNITYSSDGRAYIGFDDKQSAEEFRDSISEPSLLDDAQIMNNYKWEVKFYCDREYLNQLQQELENDWTPEQKEELDFQERLARIAPDIFYDPVESICYLGFRAKGRADNYGSYLTRILDIAEKYVVVNKPRITTNTKYELKLETIAEEDAKHLSKFNLKKEYDDSKNKDARELWRTTRQRIHPPACKPLSKLTPLEKIKLGDIVYLNSIDNQYKVLQKVELDGIPHCEVICVFNSERPSLVGELSYLKECYLVPADSVQIDSQFHQEEEEVLTTEDFPPAPYKLIPLNQVEVCDIVSTGEYVKGFYEVYAHNGDHLLGRCLYHDSLPLRIGNEGYYITTPYLVEKCSQSEVLAHISIEKRDRATAA